MLEKAKLWLRIAGNDFDGEITDLIEACKADLKRCGVIRCEESDPLVQQAIKLYCKANFGYDERAERFGQAYSALRDSMSMCGDYNTAPK